MRGRIVVAAVALAGVAFGHSPDLIPDLMPDLMKECEVRSIGPAAPGGRIVDVAIHASRPWEIWAASASGGVWKSVNNGTTWSCAFDRALSIGAVAVAPSDPDVVWIGTGEGNNQRSSYAGNGVWRSTDGGATWSHLGLEETHHVGRIAVDPSDPHVAWVAALGHLYTWNDERGLYKTTDGGDTWELVLALGDSIGVADVAVDPLETGTVYAASYERLRRAWNFDDVGDSAIYKSTDGGASWRRLAGGLPKGKLGRIGLALFPGDPNRIYACIDNENPAPAPQQGAIGGEIWRSLDGGRSFEKRNEKPVSGEPPYYYGQIRVDPHDPESVWLLGIVVFVSKDGGKSFSEGEVASSLHSDHHALWFDPARRDRIVLGNDGGLAQSYDGGATWDSYGNLSLGQFYSVSVDLRRPYCVYGGLQDNGIWRGPSRSRSPRGTDGREWRFLGGGDGMYVVADPKDPDTVYLEAQFGSLQRTDVDAYESRSIRPPTEPAGPAGPAVNDHADRYNWCAPLLVSSHNSQVVYFGAQRLWRSLDRGDHWKAASGDLTTNDPRKLKGSVPHCTLTTISESPLDPDLLLVGSDDGRVHWTEDGGRTWSELSGRFPGLRPRLWVSRVELSRHDRAAAWVAFSGYRDDDFTPWVYRTRDGGKTFERVADSLPEGPVNVVHESPRRKDALFLGSDGGAFFSIDGGDRWRPLAVGLPTVSVVDLAVHPREREVVLATHGRGLFVVDVTAHEQLGADVLSSDAWLFAPGEAVLWRNLWGLAAGASGERHYRGANPPAGAAIWYWLRRDGGKPSLEVRDGSGKVVRTLEAVKGAGLHRVNWDFRFDPPKEAATPADAAKEPSKRPRRRRLEEEGEEQARSEPGELVEREEFDLPAAQDSGRGRKGGGQTELAKPGRYTIRLSVGGRTIEQALVVRADPDFPGE